MKKFEKFVKEKGFTGYSLAKALGRTNSHVYQWFYGKQNPSITDLIKLKKILNVSGDEILEMFAEGSDGEE